ncbi:carbohydrate ABC transporter permease [Paenibacillus sp. UNC499MF]|uniref:carbohydrate ABC transporter permease n=1 Tax=Paenibacillus sp. UNC499MF TaxID=1502751 RepID=UPI0008A0874F|nr:sugar ABC transporter permease [Paenibacillus sp. UNC499MF]SEG43609.1 multiple sugar transport system permease protein [Paenibacillus sp. UNC499MF]
MSTERPNRSTVKFKPGRSGMAAREAMWAYLFIAPVVLGLAVFYTLPALGSLVLSFFDWDGLSRASFIGFDNFAALAKDEDFLRSLWNTFLFTAGSVPLSIACATLIAVLLNQPIRGLTVYRTLFFIPVVTMPVAVGMVWRWLYNSEYGLINQVLGFLHLPQPNWLFDEHIALLSIILVSVWMNVGYNAIILLSGLQGISRTYYEASSLDGAGSWRKFVHITVPLLSPSLFFVLIISFINSLQVFDLIYMMMGKDQSMLTYTRTAVFSIWEQGFKFFHLGYASAQAWVLSVVLMLITLIQMYFQKKWVHYE